MTTRLAPFVPATHRQGAPVGQVGWDGISTAPSTAMIASLVHLIFFASKHGQGAPRVTADGAGLVHRPEPFLTPITPRDSQSAPTAAARAGSAGPPLLRSRPSVSQRQAE